jgi:tape measure domain-containing protein
MGTIKSAIVLEDKMTPALSSVAGAGRAATAVMGNLTGSVSVVQQDLMSMGIELNRLESDLADARRAEEALNAALASGNGAAQLAALSNPAYRSRVQVEGLARRTQDLRAALIGTESAASAAGAAFNAYGQKVSDAGAKTEETRRIVVDTGRAGELAGQASARGFESFSGKIVTVNALLGLARTGIRAFSGFAHISDDLSMVATRADLVNEAFGTQVDMQNRIFAAAQRTRGNYLEMFEAVSKLGLQAKDAFSDPAQVIAFSELVTKTFKIGGADAITQSNAVRQLTQALASGRLQGDEFRSITEGAPLLAQGIADYVGVSIGELKALAAEGKVTSDIIVKAMFSMGDEINQSFERLPKTFNDAMNNLKNNAMRAITPITERFSAFLNSQKFQEFADKAVMGIYTIIGVFDKLLPYLPAILGAVGAALAGLTIQPAIAGILKAVSGLNVPLLIMAGLVAVAVHAWNNWGETGKVLAVVLGVVAAGVATWTAMQWLLNVALVANPIGAVIMLIAIFIAAIVAVATWLENLWKYNAEFKIGVLKIWNAIVYGIGYAVGLLVTTNINYFILLYNLFTTFAEFLLNVFVDPIGAIGHLFFDLFDGILNVVQGAATLLGRIFGQDWGGAIGDFRAELDAFEKERLGDNKMITLERKEYLDPRQVGAGALQLFGAAYSPDQIREEAEAARAERDRKQAEKVGFSMGADPGFDYEAMLGDLVTGTPGGKALKTANQNEIMIKDEDLKMLHDIALRDYQLNYQQLTPQLNVHVDTIRETADTNKIIEILADGVAEMVGTRLVVPS